MFKFGHLGVVFTLCAFAACGGGDRGDNNREFTYQQDAQVAYNTGTRQLDGDNVALTGAVSGSAGGCSVAARTDGNVYNASITFGAAPCLFAGKTLSCLAYYNATTRRLLAAASKESRTDGGSLVGIKP